MALDLELWAQLNMVGNVSWSDYMYNMSPEDAEAALAALNSVIEKSKRQQQKRDEFERFASQYEKRG